MNITHKSCALILGFLDK